VGRRLEFIEFRLFWEGSINRADLVEAFGVSVPQASKDLTLYQERAPAHVPHKTNRSSFWRRRRLLKVNREMLKEPSDAGPESETGA
jgi:hypothetical protein